MTLLPRLGLKTTELFTYHDISTNNSNIITYIQNKLPVQRQFLFHAHKDTPFTEVNPGWEPPEVNHLYKTPLQKKPRRFQ